MEKQINIAQRVIFLFQTNSPRISVLMTQLGAIAGAALDKIKNDGKNQNTIFSYLRQERGK
ncbi:hypothetical protein [uncultured Mailhella sp.]|uniref:hypothetical protein n=1 Tax=uncultured Mailhella sp. TaxID=1981031 RepID=UPI00260FE4F8|nr:hypothetical protein [uncultured Mailhella sp.]